VAPLITNALAKSVSTVKKRTLKKLTIDYVLGSGKPRPFLSSKTTRGHVIEIAAGLVYRKKVRMGNESRFDSRRPATRR